MKNTIFLDNLCQNFKADDKRIIDVKSHLSQTIDLVKMEMLRKENRSKKYCLVVESIDKEEPLVAMEIKRFFGGTYKTIHNSNRYNLKDMKKLYDYGGSGVKIYLMKGL